MRNVRLFAAVGFALLAAAAGALAVGLQTPALGAIAAVAGVVAAAVASTGWSGSNSADPVGADTSEEAEPEAPSPRPAADDPGSDDGLVDSLTGLFDHRYFTVSLERRVAAARRKLSPLSLVLLRLEPDESTTAPVSDQSIKVLAAVVRAVLRDSDTGCRVDHATLALLLEETPEAGAVWATERVRAGFFATTFRGNVKLAAGIASYPAHALDAGRLLTVASDATARSSRAGDESIEIARVDESAEGAGN